MTSLARGVLVALVALESACSPSPPPRLKSDTVLGVHVGMRRRELAKSFAPRGPGKWYELESMAGEGRLRWAADGADGAPQALDVTLGPDGRVRELIFTLRADDARAELAKLAAPSPSGVTRFEGPSGQVIVAPGLGAWTLRLSAPPARL